MSKSLPPNDLGTLVVAENCQKLSVHKLLRQYQRQWQEQLAGTIVDVMDTSIRFTPSKMGHGGKRLWFACPECNRRCGTLFQHPLSKIIGCRLCLGVRYSKSRYRGMLEAAQN